MTELASEPMTSAKDVWYDVSVAWVEDGLTVSRGLSGGELSELFSVETTLENESTAIGFGVGDKAEFRFDEVRLSSPTVVTLLSKGQEYTYDALGRRVAVTTFDELGKSTMKRYPPTADDRKWLDLPG